jgi:hypothetical protein
MDARTLAAPLVALVVGLAFGFVLRGPSADRQPERSTGPSAIELPRELQERLTRIEQLLGRSSLAVSEPPTRAPLDESTTAHTDLLDELRALIAEERAARTSQPTQSPSSETVRWQELEFARPPIDTAALSALANEWQANDGYLPPRYLASDLNSIVSEFGWPTEIERSNDGLILAYQVDFQTDWSERPLKRVTFGLHAFRLVSLSVR